MVRLRRTLAGCIGLNLLGASLVLGQAEARPVPPLLGDAPSAATSTSNLWEGQPTLVEIPTITMAASVLPVGKQADGAMETPAFGKVGWYREGANPGEIGPTVLVGHVDNRTGPDVFYGLRRLRPGDEVTLRRGGQVAVFIVTGSERVKKTELPTERIFGATPASTLRLITCGGRFDRRARSYEENLVVYAERR